MKTAQIIKQIIVGDFVMQVTQSSDSLNGLIYKREGHLVACVACGIHEGIERLTEKAKAKVL